MLRNKIWIAVIGFVVFSGTNKADELKDCSDQCEIAVGKEKFGNPKYHECKEEERKRRAECESRQSRPTDIEMALKNTAECAKDEGNCNMGMVLFDLSGCLSKCEEKFLNKDEFGEFIAGPVQNEATPEEEIE